LYADALPPPIVSYRLQTPLHFDTKSVSIALESKVLIFYVPFASICKYCPAHIILVAGKKIDDGLMPESRSDIYALSVKHACVTMTFRIEKTVMEVPRSESERLDVSLNTLLNQILRRYPDWDIYEAKVSMETIAKLLVSAIFKRAGERKY
jgi:hypothetical protein